jgi:[histone H3]-lysine36 N-dimethyltransferase SETMAR
MMDEKLFVRSCMLYEFKLNHSAREAAINICRALGEGSVGHVTCSHWFQKFRSGDTDLKDDPRPGREPTVNDEQLRNLLEIDKRQTTRELAEKLGCSHTAVENHLHAMGKVLKLGTWVPHVLTDDHKASRITTCNSLLLHPHRKDFLNDIVTGDEKWVMYANHNRKRQWVDRDQQPEPYPKPDLHQKKIMLSIWWDVKGVIYFELLPPNTTVDATLYCTQMERLQVALTKERPKRDKVRLLHDNARPHTAKKTREKIQELGWEVLPHPAYSPDLAPSDYHLFRSLSNHLENKDFDNQDHLQKDLEHFFNSKPENFYDHGIRQLPERWAQVVESNGEYIVD